jgi:hypothetical protein
MECQATTLDGTQCSRIAEPDSKYCWQHQNYEEHKNKSSIELLTELMGNLTTYNANNTQKLMEQYKTQLQLESSNPINLKDTLMRERPILQSSGHTITFNNGKEYINGLPLIPNEEFKSLPLAQNNSRIPTPNFAYSYGYNYGEGETYKLRGDKTIHIPNTTPSTKIITKSPKTKSKPKNYVPKSTDIDYSEYMD